VTDETLREGCQNFGQQSAHQLRYQRPYFADKGPLAEVVVTLKQQQDDLWRAVSSKGNVLDVLLQRRETRMQPSAAAVNC
jgi:putative transposase